MKKGKKKNAGKELLRLYGAVLSAALLFLAGWLLLRDKAEAGAKPAAEAPGKLLLLGSPELEFSRDGSHWSRDLLLEGSEEPVSDPAEPLCVYLRSSRTGRIYLERESDGRLPLCFGTITEGGTAERLLLWIPRPSGRDGVTAGGQAQDCASGRILLGRELLAEEKSGAAGLGPVLLEPVSGEASALLLWTEPEGANEKAPELFGPGLYTELHFLLSDKPEGEALSGLYYDCTLQRLCREDGSPVAEGEIIYSRDGISWRDYTPPAPGFVHPLICAGAEEKQFFLRSRESAARGPGPLTLLTVPAAD